MSQIGFDGMPQALFTASPSKLNTWLDCPRRFRLQYLEKKKAPFSWAHNSMGSATHIALSKWFDLEIVDRTPEAGAALVRSSWVHDGFRDEEQSLTWQGRAADMVAKYLADVDPASEPIARERQVAFTSDVLSMAGKVDRVDLEIDDEGEHAVVVDYKTGKHLLTDDDARTSLALAAYVLGVRRTMKKRCYRVELHHIPTQQVAAFEHTEESLARHLRRADSIGKEAQTASLQFSALDKAMVNGEAQAIEQADELFPANVSSLCGWCDMRRWCTAGQQGADAKQSWAGLAQEMNAPDFAE